jgi:hypothetical protein
MELQRKKQREDLAMSGKMQFILTGFRQEMGFRVFAFERMGEDRVRTNWTVRADLDLIRRYGIRLQELPLMCRGLLEQGDDLEETRSMVFGEEQMRACANERASAKESAAHKKKAPRRPAVENPGTAWGNPQPF